MIDDNDENISKNHSQLLKSVAELDHNFLKIKRSERNELTSEISEFHLVRSGITDDEPVRLDNLVNTLRGQDQSLKLSNQYKATKKRAKVLPKPLEKTADEKFKREVCFENNSESLKKWNPIVTKNRIADHLVFPINTPSNKLSENIKIKSNRLQSDLEKEYASLEPLKETEDNENQLDKFSITKEEMIQKAKENAKFRAQQSYKAEKARRRNKIKSKKFHKIEKKAKIKQQFEEFDKLQKSNPELALQKLEELDKARAEERMSLKHKNTGQWARNKQVRAKYDKESRQVLAQQLSISRELTQKIRKDDSDDEEDEDLETNFSATKSDPLEYNPWVNNEIFLIQPEKNISSSEKEHQTDIQNECQILNNNPINPVEQVSIEYVNGKNGKHTPELGKKRKIKELKCVAESEVKKIKKLKAKCLKKKSIKHTADSGTSKWEVEVADKVSQPSSLYNKKLPKISEIFETLENDNQRKVMKKLKKLERKLKTKSAGKNKKMTINSDSENLNLSFKPKKNRPFIDDALDETGAKHDNKINKKVQVTEHQSKLELNKSKNISTASVTEIDPNNFIHAKSKHLNLKNELPDDLKNEVDVLDESDEEEPEQTQQNIISEAFIDDDVVNEFKNEKAAEMNNSQIRHLETKLPGWGSWGDKNSKISLRKKRRFIINSSEKDLRKDKENVIIIDDVDAKLKQHQVNDLPHPFVTVKDFEASIRAPIGRNFVPEISHRQLIKPPVKTRMGTIIEPMNEDVLLKEKSLSISMKKKKKQLNKIKL